MGGGGDFANRQGRNQAGIYYFFLVLEILSIILSHAFGAKKNQIVANPLIEYPRS